MHINDIFETLVTVYLFLSPAHTLAISLPAQAGWVAKLEERKRLKIHCLQFSPGSIQATSGEMMSQLNEFLALSR